MEPLNAQDIIYIPIEPDREKMAVYLADDFCRSVFTIYEELYKNTRIVKPWTGYFALSGGIAIGVGGFKGAPANGRIEIAYGTAPQFEGRGVSSATCRFLTELALQAEPGLTVIARTLREENASTSILKKNGFEFSGEALDPEDGLVWEWVYRG